MPQPASAHCLRREQSHSGHSHLCWRKLACLACQAAQVSARATGSQPSFRRRHHHRHRHLCCCLVLACWCRHRHQCACLEHAPGVMARPLCCHRLRSHHACARCHARLWSWHPVQGVDAIVLYTAQVCEPLPSACAHACATRLVHSARTTKSNHFRGIVESWGSWPMMPTSRMAAVVAACSGGPTTIHVHRHGAFHDFEALVHVPKIHDLHQQQQLDVSPPRAAAALVSVLVCGSGVPFAVTS